MKKIQGFFAVLFVVLLLIPCAYAASDQGGQGNAGMPPPPPGSGNFTGGPGPGGGNALSIPQSSIAVCSGKPEGSACKDGIMVGTCEYTPDKKCFACKPDFQKRPGGEPSKPMGQPPAGMGQNSTSGQ
jgi:hypothetical protein